MRNMILSKKIFLYYYDAWKYCTSSSAKLRRHSDVCDI